MLTNEKIKLAVDICEGKQIEEYQKFFKIYPFSTENLAGWMTLFDFSDKSFLTVGSSCDQVFNAALLGSKKQTVIDINPFVKEYYYLKKASLSALSRKEFLEFFCFYNFNREKNKKVFNRSTFNKIAPILSEYNYDAYLFWNKIFETVNGNEIKQNLFLSDEERCSPILQKMNLYLNNDDSYNQTKEAIKKLNVDFIGLDIYQNEEWGLYDNINLSNIGQYSNSQEDLVNFRNIVLKLSEHLNVNGMMMFMYIFGTIKNVFDPSHDSKFVKSSMTKLFNDVNNEIHSFPSVKELVLNDRSSPDYVMIYRKIK